mmetsp:Transcript_22441/g.69626  ORF Transcript_22441/g.69626 Transcript_22441/m.69626 type:complete len:335 (+) Transcript_22441:1010-2014(+)
MVGADPDPDNGDVAAWSAEPDAAGGGASAAVRAPAASLGDAVLCDSCDCARSPGAHVSLRHRAGEKAEAVLPLTTGAVVLFESESASSKAGAVAGGATARRSEATMSAARASAAETVAIASSYAASNGLRGAFAAVLPSAPAGGLPTAPAAIVAASAWAASTSASYHRRSSGRGRSRCCECMPTEVLRGVPPWLLPAAPPCSVAADERNVAEALVPGWLRVAMEIEPRATDRLGESAPVVGVVAALLPPSSSAPLLWWLAGERVFGRPPELFRGLGVELDRCTGGASLSSSFVVVIDGGGYAAELARRGAEPSRGRCSAGGGVGVAKATEGDGI